LIPELIILVSITVSVYARKSSLKLDIARD